MYIECSGVRGAGGSPLGQFILRAVQVVADEKAFCILSFSISDNTAVQYSHMRQPYKTQKKEKCV